MRKNQRTDHPFTDSVSNFEPKTSICTLLFKYRVSADKIVGMTNIIQSNEFLILEENSFGFYVSVS